MEVVDMTEELWVAEYSPGQDHFHLQPLAAALQKNSRTVDLFLKNLTEMPYDWVIFAVGTYEEVFAATVEKEKLRKSPLTDYRRMMQKLHPSWPGRDRRRKQ